MVDTSIYHEMTIERFQHQPSSPDETGGKQKGRTGRGCALFYGSLSLEGEVELKVDAPDSVRRSEV